jgi:FMN-dependent oxidoreductase (nitrilotriacetate monooxygenase family)
MRADKMRLGAFLQGAGHHVAAWRHDSAQVDGASNFQHYANLAAIAERGKLDMLFLSDSLAMNTSDVGVLARMTRTVDHFEPITLLSALAAMTRHVGLVATASTTFNEPYNIARAFASLDQISGGRAGWNVVSSTSPLEAANFGRPLPAHDDRYERAGEFAEVVRKLWASWEPGAFVRDRTRGLYFDPGKLRVLHHKGRFFDVKGPLSVGPSPQQRPIMVVAGASEPGRELTAATADVAFSAEQKLDLGQAFYADLKGRLARYGRAPDDLKVMPGVMPIVGRTQAEAESYHEELQQLVLPQVGKYLLSSIVGVSLDPYPDDGPVPDLSPADGQQSRQQLILRIARDKGLTLRETYLEIASARAHHLIIGTPAMVADRLSTWFEGRAADGFNVLAPTYPGGLERFVDLVVPELQDRGLFRTEYESSTLRGNLGLPLPRLGGVASQAAD